MKRKEKENKKEKLISIIEDLESWNSYILLMGMQNSLTTIEINQNFLKNLNVELMDDVAFPLLGIGEELRKIMKTKYPNQSICINVVTFML